MGWLKDRLKSWLEIVPANEQCIAIYEHLTFSGEVMRNRIWYRGDSSELDQFYKQIGTLQMSDMARFWAAAPSDERIRKIHSGLPAMMVDTISYIVTSDRSDVVFDGGDGIKSRWDEIAQEINFDALVAKAVTNTLVCGDGAFKISIDTDLSAHPLVEFFAGDDVQYIRKYGRIVGVDFWSTKSDGKRMYRLRERYSKQQGESLISYALFDGDKEVPLSTLPELSELKPARVAGDYLLAVPIKFFDNPRFPGRGKSLYDGKTDVFDAHDEVISQWIDALRAGRVHSYIPEDMIPSSPQNGSKLPFDAFGNRFIQVNPSGGVGAQEQIQTIQPDIKYDAFLSTYSATLDMCLQGIISPATLGIDVGKMSSGTAQREKKDITGNTRNAITAVLEKVLPQLVSAILMTDDNMHGEAPGEYEPNATFGEYGAPDFDSRIDTISKASATSIMSIESQVDELWGNSKDDKWKRSEVLRIKQLRGVDVAEEPSVGEELNADMATVIGSVRTDGVGADIQPKA